MKLVHWIFGICLFTASCDLILNLNVGGSVRLAQLLMIFVCLAAVAKITQEGRILWPRGATALMVWVMSQLLFVPLSGDIFIGIQFFVLLLFTVMGLFAVVQIYGRSDYIEPLMKTYLASYIFIAICGLVQFVMPVVGLHGPLVVQWILHGRIPRINGFCYEPSFFATYLIMGWVMLVELRVSGARITQGRFWKVATLVVTAALFLSTSKTAWLFMLLELVARVVPHLWRTFHGSLVDMQSGRLRIRLPRSPILITAAVCVAVLASLVFVASRYVDPMIFLSGTGIAGTPAHSVNQRSEGARETLAAFEEHPFIGRSLGGVPIYIAAQHGVQVSNRDELRKYWGFPVPLDVLVASGIFGFIPFVIFVYTNTFGALRLARRRWPEERAKWLRALARAMIFVWMALLADQNLMRIYLWFHFTMVAVVAYHLEFMPEPKTVPSVMLELPNGYEQAPAVS